MNCAEAYSCMPHKRFQTCHARGVIDADLSRSRRGIAEKGHLWMDTQQCLKRSRMGTSYEDLD